MNSVVEFVFYVLVLALVTSSSVGLISQLDCAHGSAKIDLILFEFVAKPMCNYSHQVRCLSQCSIDFIPFNIDQLVDSAKPESADGPELVLRRYLENFIHNIGFPQFLVQNIDILDLAVHLLIHLQLVHELSFIIIDFAPNIALLIMNHLLALPQILQHLLLLLFLLSNILQSLIKLPFLLLQLPQLLEHLLILQILCLSQLLLDLLKLILVHVSLFFMTLHFVFQMLQYLCKTLKTNWVLELDVLLVGEVLDTQGQQAVAAEVGGRDHFEVGVVFLVVLCVHVAAEEDGILFEDIDFG